jgi:hypothetical protein
VYDCSKLHQEIRAEGRGMEWTGGVGLDGAEERSEKRREQRRKEG